jgi:ATP-binding cassette subfamily C (CFTR/MRP) protein 1
MHTVADPVLHAGTVHHNLDPFGITSTEKVRDALRRARLPEDFIDKSVSKGGTNLSSGERQLCAPSADLRTRTRPSTRDGVCATRRTRVLTGISRSWRSRHMCRLCFARSLLEDAKILILDEATSNLDEGSDASIQALLRTEFGQHTIISTAHQDRRTRAPPTFILTRAAVPIP